MTIKGYTPALMAALQKDYLIILAHGMWSQLCSTKDTSNPRSLIGLILAKAVPNEKTAFKLISAELGNTVFPFVCIFNILVCQTTFRKVTWKKMVYANQNK